MVQEGNDADTFRYNWSETFINFSRIEILGVEDLPLFETPYTVNGILLFPKGYCRSANSNLGIMEASKITIFKPIIT